MNTAYGEHRKDNGDLINLQEFLNTTPDIGGDISSSDVIATGSDTRRSLADRFADVVNVKDFGAKGDGVVDDTLSVQSALATGKSVYIPAGEYHITSNLALQSNTHVFSEGATFLVKGTWTDSTGGHYARKRAVVYGQSVENVKIEGIEIAINFNTVDTSLANTGWMLRDCKRIELTRCKTTHSVARTEALSGFDLEHTNTNIWINKCLFVNKTGNEFGGCWVRQIATGTSTSGIWITENEFTKDSGDECLAVYGVDGLVSDVYIEDNIFRGTGDLYAHGQLISVFPFDSDPTASNRNIHITGNSIYDTGFVNEVIRIGQTGEEDRVCNDIVVSGNYIKYTNSGSAAAVIRYIQNTGSRVICKDNIIEQDGGSQISAIIRGDFSLVEGNIITASSDFTFYNCLRVNDNVANNTAPNGYAFYNVEDFSDNVCTSSLAGTVFGRNIRTRVKNNTFTVTGSVASFVTNNIGSTTPSFWIEGNVIEATQSQTATLTFANPAGNDNVLLNNNFLGIVPTEYYSGGNNQFTQVSNNQWFGFTDEYADGTSGANPAYRSYGYNRMIPLGKFVYNNAIGTGAGSQTLGWSKQEINSTGSDWKHIQATVL